MEIAQFQGSRRQAGAVLHYGTPLGTNSTKNDRSTKEESSMEYVFAMGTRLEDTLRTPASEETRKPQGTD
ncbi:hypothetical protein DPEC_G00308470 [Dallia pectoralis]|uniref:Uncharacterized protein n=1 Tax=Dallia pectoralis TaxID=75939 RepID=A0ACC2FEP2_DALPE|nr:hypothetical protein DPEC_G00308470 [Dallia pectoralis]